MPIQKTLSIIKPNAVKNNRIGSIISMLEDVGLKVVDAKMVQLKREEAEEFYREHKKKPFFPNLVSFMTSGPTLVMTLEGDDAIALNRKIMGATNPAEAKTGTIRSKFGEGLTENAIHGSDSDLTAQKEIRFFFG